MHAMSTAVELERAEAPQREDWITLVESLVGNPDALDRRLATRAGAAALLPRLLGMALLTWAAWAVVQAGLLHAADVAPTEGAALGAARSGLALFAAYAGGCLGAGAACLPGFYLATLLSGLRVPGWRLSAEFVRAQACSVVLLLGLLPLYVMGALTLIRLELEWAQIAVFLGYGLPFAAGINGRRALQRAFEELGGGRRAAPLVDGGTALLTALACSGASWIFRALGA
jgi:hypothetical protein